MRSRLPLQYDTGISKKGDVGPHWDTVSNAAITVCINGIQDQRFSHNARSAETARTISGWSLDQNAFPTVESGLHEGFIKQSVDRKETRERLVRIILDAVAALERCCGVACIFAVFQGERRPSEAMDPAHTLSLNDRNVRLFSSNIFTLYPHIYDPAIEDIKTICLSQLGIAYMRDFRTHAKRSNYFAKALMEPLEPTHSIITQAQTLPLDVLSGLWSPLRCTSAPISHGEHAPTVSDELGTFGQLSSRIASLSVREDGPRPSTPYPDSRLSWTGLGPPNLNVSSLRQQRSPSPTKKKKLPALVIQLLNSLREGQSKSGEVLAVYNYVPQQCQEEALVDIGFNQAVAKALISLQN
ncbi:hypothetical protein BGW80DRAFT_1254598 [Lactifluus volemus]|nr:hypothetical protein BGW80DRAFT_1254598 [Lactifluus volemus]